jgi:hypothetical protein
VVVASGLGGAEPPSARRRPDPAWRYPARPRPANPAPRGGRLAQSPDIRGCFAQKYFEYAASHTIDARDQCSVDRLKKTFVPSGDLRELVTAIATSDSFRLRLSEGGAP